MIRYFSRLALAWLMLASAAVAAGEAGTALPVNSLVFARRPGVHFRVNKADKGEMRAGISERVQKVQGEWLWVRRGWLQRRDVVPVWEAVEFFSEQIAKRPTAFAYVSRASALGKRGGYPDEIRSDIDSALQLDHDFPEAFMVRGVLLSAQGDVEGGIDAFNDAIRLCPQLAEAYNDRGTALRKAGKTDAALKDFDRAIELCPSLTTALVNRASLSVEKGDLAAALAGAREALKHDARYADAHFIIGRVWEAKGDEERAVSAFSEALRIDRRNGKARLARGLVHLKRGNHQQAVADLNQAVQLFPKNATLLELRGYAYYRLGAMEKSVADEHAAARLRKQTSPDPTPDLTAQPGGQPGVADMTSDHLNFVGKCKLAVAQLSFTASPGKGTQDLLDSTSGMNRRTDADGRAGSANNFSTGDDFARGVAGSTVMRARTLNGTARRQATSTDERYLDGERAVEQATEACELTGWQRAEFIDTLAAAYAQSGDFDAAVKWQTKAIELAPANSSFKTEAERRCDLYRANTPCREDSSGAATSPIESDEAQP